MGCLSRSVVCMIWLGGAVVGCATSTPNDVDDPVATGAVTSGDDAPPAPAPPLEAFTQDLDKTTITFEMVPVAGGSVENESGEQVEVAPFWIATTEVPWELYDVFVFQLDETDGPIPETEAITRPSRPYVAPDRGYGHQGYPTISASAKGAAQFCVWLSAKTGRTYRLPTEAQWRLACAQSGVTPEAIAEHAWYEGNADRSPHPVGAKKPDVLGLYDLYGNVREWCQTEDGEYVALGGSWRDDIDNVGCSAREIPTPEWQERDPQIPKSVWWLSDADFVGIRLICVPEEAKEASDAADGAGTGD